MAANDQCADEMTEAEEQALRAKLAELKEEHRDLDAAIATMSDTGAFDQLRLTRLKKRKLQLRDEIARIEDELLPDIIA
jgi:hypothetical protein